MKQETRRHATRCFPNCRKNETKRVEAVEARRDGKPKKKRFARKEREVKARLRIDMARAATIKVKAFPRPDVPARPRPPSPSRSEKEASKLSIL